jgi:hypothetical protein
MLEVTILDAWFAVAGMLAFVAVAALIVLLVDLLARRHAERAVEPDGLPVEGLVLDDMHR